MHDSKKTLAFALLALAWTVPGLAQTGGAGAGSRRELGLREAIEESLAGSTALAIAEAQRDIAERGSRAASSPLWPQVSVGSHYMRSVDPVVVFGTKLRQGTFGPDDLDFATPSEPAPSC